MTVEIRETSAAEAAPIADLLNRHAQSLFGEAEIDEAEVRHWLAMPGLWVRVASRNGDLVGYLDVNSAGESGSSWLDVRALDAEAAEALLEAGSSHAGSDTTRVVVQGPDEILRGVTETAGWKLMRQSYRMLIELSDAIPEPRWPEGVAVRTMEPGEEGRLYEANNAAFADHWDFHQQPFDQWAAYAFGREDFDPSLVWLAEDAGELAGFAVNRWNTSGDPEFGWVEILGVRPQWRRRGLATALLRHSFLDFRGRGATRVGLGVDAENTTGAVRLYERVGMQVARHNDFYERPRL
ncbi:MAG TPA: GNAT family N-acetyltransferase [Gaiellaceae bacterium]